MTAAEYRPIRTSELDEAYRLERACYTPEAAATRDAFAYRQARYGEYFWSAWIDGRLAGIANGVRTDRPDTADDGMKSGRADSPDGRYFCVLTVAVDPSLRRAGIGSRLMERLVGEAERGGLAGVALMCEAHLIPFYERLGFRYAGVSPSAHAGIEWHEMRRMLGFGARHGHTL